MIRKILRVITVASAIVTANSAYAASEVFAYGESLDQAQNAALNVAERSAKSKDTCVGGISTCKKQDEGLYRCGAWVADHKGSCNKDGSDIKKALDALKNF